MFHDQYIDYCDTAAVLSTLHSALGTSIIILVAVGVSSIQFYLLQRMSVILSSSLLVVFVILVVIVLAVTGQEGVEIVTEAVSISDAGEIQEDRFMESKEFRVSRN